jgi:hypothetical protein
VWAVAFDPDSGEAVAGLHLNHPDFGVVTGLVEHRGRLWMGSIGYPAVAHGAHVIDGLLTQRVEDPLIAAVASALVGRCGGESEEAAVARLAGQQQGQEAWLIWLTNSQGFQIV